jgi:diguanylate cyclase (GGDEF)-like protein
MLMKANTALLLLLSALSLTLTQNVRSEHSALIGRIAGVLICLVAGAVLAEYIFHVSLGLDTLIAADAGSAHPGRMAPQTASAFLLLGVVTICIRVDAGLRAIAVDLFACGFCSLVLLIVTGYTLGAFRFFGVSQNTVVAPQTLLALMLLAFVVFSRRAEQGVLLAIFVGSGVGSRIARIAGPFSLLVPFMLEAGRGRILQAALFSPEYSVALMVVLAAIIGFALVLTLAWRIDGLEQDIRDLSIRDELTKLYNRRGFLLMAQRGMQLAHRAESPFSVLFIDLDRLKRVNDTLGHSSGSAFLCEMANLLMATFRETEVVGRIGGDEFVVAGALSDAGVRLAVERLEMAAGKRNREAGHAYPLNFSLGHVTSEASGRESLEELMTQADAAMYIAKRSRGVTRDS